MPPLAQWELPELSAVSSLSLGLSFFIPVLYISSDKHSSHSGLDRLTGSLPGLLSGLGGVIFLCRGNSRFFHILLQTSAACLAQVGVRLALADTPMVVWVPTHGTPWTLEMVEPFLVLSWLWQRTSVS